MKRLLVITLIFCTGCADMKFFVKDELKRSKPVRILIGEFISRDMNYDPFLAEQLIETIRFVFFSNNYDVKVFEQYGIDKKMSNSTADAAALCTSMGADVLVTGVISRKESGSFADRSVYYSVAFVIRDKSGKIMGEAHYSDSNVDEPVFVSEAAQSFVNEFTKQVKGE